MLRHEHNGLIQPNTIMRNLNPIGPQVRRLRMLRGWTQHDAAVKLQMAGWNISRGALAKIESRRIKVGDTHLFFLAKAFEVPVQELFPLVDPQDPNLHETLCKLMLKSY